VPLARRLAGVLAAAALVPALYWLGPALPERLAPSFRDQGDFFYPLKLYTADRLRAGEIPLWNPLSGAGEPWLANGQAGVFYPPALLFLIPSPSAAAILFLLVHFAVAAWGMRRFLAQEGVSDAGALFGSAVFAGSGFAASLSAYWNHFGAWAYLPAIAALARSGSRSRGAVLALGVLTGLQAMAGSPEISGATLLLALVLALFPRSDPEKPWLDSRRRSVLRASAGVLLGLALAAWVLVPMGELALNSDRRGALPVEEREPGAIAPAALARSLLGTEEAARPYYIASLLVGPLALAAAAAAFFERQRRTLALLLAAVALAGLVLAAAGPPGSWLRGLPPLDRLRYPEKALAATVFAVAALSGLGLDTLRFRGGRRVSRFLFALFASVALALALISRIPAGVRWATAAGLGALLLLAFGGGRREAAGGFLAGLAALVLVAALALASRSLFAFVPESELRRRPEVLEALGNLPGRVLTPPMRDLARWVVRDWSFDAATLRRQREALVGYTNLLFGISTVGTAAALPTQGARTIAETADRSPDPVVAAGPASARLLWSPFRPARLPSRRVGSFFRAPIAPYRPRLSFARGYQVEPDSRRAWERVAAGEIDVTREVFLDREPFPAPPAVPPPPILVARLAEDRPERVVAEISSNTSGLLVLTDLFYPGWIAQVEGRELEILRADGFFRAVALPAGSHRVTFRYRPLSFYVGAGVSVLALLTLLFLVYQGEPVPVGRR